MDFVCYSKARLRLVPVRIAGVVRTFRWVLCDRLTCEHLVTFSVVLN